MFTLFCFLISGISLKNHSMRQLKISKSITNRESASLDKYLAEIGRKPMITAEEEADLGALADSSRGRLRSVTVHQNVGPMARSSCS